jgi:hypothetical protein
MTSHTRTEDSHVAKADKIITKLTNTTDFSKLFKDNKFLEQIQKLPQLEQLKIFEQFKDKFTQISNNSGSAISKWIGNFTSLPKLGEDTINNGMQQISESLRNSLGQIIPK